MAYSRNIDLLCDRVFRFRKQELAYRDQSPGILRTTCLSTLKVQRDERIGFKLREFVAGNAELLRKIESLEKKYEGHDKQLQQIFQVIRSLVGTEPLSKRRIGIKSDGAPRDRSG